MKAVLIIMSENCELHYKGKITSGWQHKMKYQGGIPLGSYKLRVLHHINVKFTSIYDRATYIPGNDRISGPIWWVYLKKSL